MAFLASHTRLSLRSLTLIYCTRNNIAAAKLAGLQEELGLDSFQYETAVSVLFFGYLLMQVPSNLILNKIGKPALYLPSCVSQISRPSEWKRLMYMEMSV